MLVVIIAIFLFFEKPPLLELRKWDWLVIEVTSWVTASKEAAFIDFHWRPVWNPREVLQVSADNDEDVDGLLACVLFDSSPP